MVDAVIARPGAAPAEALVIDGGRVGYVGTAGEARSRYSGAEEIGLAGALIAPAFVDAHTHLVQTGLVADGLDLRGAGSRTEVLDRLAAYVRQRPGRRLVLGQGWDERSWPDPTAPSRAEVDRAAGGRVVYLARVDVHSAVVSTSLLDARPEIAGLPGFGPDGLLRRDAHHAARAAVGELTTDAERRAAARVAVDAAVRQGLGCVHELGGPHLGPVEDLVRVRDEGRRIGLEVVGYWGESASDEAFARMAASGAVGLAGDLCVDGAIGSRTAALREPYADAAGRGVRYLDLDQLTEHLIACTRAGVQGGFHCIGDDAVAAAIEAVGRAGAVVGREAMVAARHRLEHVEMVDVAELGRLDTFGVVASVQPAFDAAWGAPGELYEQRLGPDRARLMNPLRSFAAARVMLAFGSDTPVTPLAGWETVRAAARHHQSRQRLSVADAFAAATIGGHAAARRSGGRLAVGERADLAIWQAEPASLDADGLPRLAEDVPLPEWQGTVLGGRLVADRDHTGAR
ncbi:amidohydrolase [Microlunatus ginsengisoli]|uniref:Amidohydrolase n=1 Tax=Microlunatus ginsengisoli TaxID=363863 RepID=A0ABP7AMM3_9ACTN